jgi:uncharacterized protein YjbJ (UPF0337 family)
MMNTIINRDVRAGKWKQVHGTVEQWWGRLTDDNQKRLSGRFEVLVGVLQERYGRTRVRAEREAKMFMNPVNRKGAS